MDPFANLISEARSFLRELADNNNREWFTANKARYEAELKTPATLLLKHVSHDVGRDWGIDLKTKLFRPQRDMRFSRDKTPYHTHLHMLWTLAGKQRQNPGFFFGISPDHVRIGGGVMGFDKAVLSGWRTAVDGPFGDELQSALQTAASLGYCPGDPELKRIPAPFDKDHRHGDLLRRKGLSVWRDLPEVEFATPLSAIKTSMDQLRPFLETLRTIL